MASLPTRRRWRYYRTAAGSEPVRDFLDRMHRDDRLAVRAAMRQVTAHGRAVARHLDGDIYEVRVGRGGQAWRLLFSAEGERRQVLLGLSAFEKKTQKTPDREIALARRRLVEWRERGSRSGL